jgi:signal peptidase I
VGIVSQGASLTVSGLVLKRDIYYTQYPGRSDYTGLLSWPLGSAADPADRAVAVFNVLADPAHFPELGNLKETVYKIRPGHYMMMGDNSPKSKDGRGWEQRDQMHPDRPDSGWDPNVRESWEVPESLLIGKAFYVYWPHGKPFGPDIRLHPDFRVPFRPYFERMKWIR